MRVHGDGGDAEGVAEDDVGGLAPDAGQADELLARLRNDAVEARAQLLSEAEEALGAGALHAEGLERGLELGSVGAGEGRCVGVALEELRGDRVDAGVGGLGGQDRGDEEMEGSVVVEGAAGVRVKEAQLVVDGGGAGDERGIRGRALAGSWHGSSECVIERSAV